MIVDDDPDILLSLREILEANGYKVYSFDNGEDLLKALSDGKKPTLIILDIMMPEMSGWDIQTRLRENQKWKKIPIVFLTARSTETAKDMCERYGIDYISKPFEIKDFLNRINTFLINSGHITQIL